MTTYSFSERYPGMAPPPATCMKTGCSKPVKWQVGLTLYAPKKYGNHPVRGETGIYVCADCGSTITLEYVVSDDGWRKVVQGFRVAGRVDPDRSLTEIRLLPVLAL